MNALFTNGELLTLFAIAFSSGGLYWRVRVLESRMVELVNSLTTHEKGKVELDARVTAIETRCNVLHNPTPKRKRHV